MEEARRSQIDEERVRELTERLDSGKTKRSEYERQLGQIQGRVQELEEQLKQQQDAVNEAERQEELSNALRLRSTVATDLLSLTTGILDRLKTDHVRRVSARMEQLFLDIVGADRAAESSLYSGLNIVSGSYDVEIHTLEGRKLDVDDRIKWGIQESAYPFPNLGTHGGRRKGSATNHRLAAWNDIRSYKV